MSKSSLESREKAPSDLLERAKEFNVIIAGSINIDYLNYDPSIVFSPTTRRGVIIGLHEGRSVEDVARLINAPLDDVLSHLEILEEAGYVIMRGDRIVPSFFIALREDVVRVKELAKHLGVEIAKRYESNWDLVVEIYSKLSISPRFGFDRVAFVLVGAYSLDVYMLEKFYEEGRLMPRPPRRRAGVFYMWGVEGGAEALGRCGMHSGEAGEYGFATFGCELERRRKAPPDHWSELLLWLMGEKDLTSALDKLIKLPTLERRRVLGEIDELTVRVLREYEKLYRDEGCRPDPSVEKYLKRWMYIDESNKPQAPIYTREDLDTIKDFADKMSIHVLNVVYENLSKVESAFRECRASVYASFSEFFCWLYHLMFSETIEYLVARQKLKPPVHGYEYWVWKKT